MIIALEGMRFWAKIGYYEEEQFLGNEIHVDVYVDTLTKGFLPTDELENTLNYETIYHLCSLEMKKPARLLETVAVNLHQCIREHFPENVNDVKVRISKISPPLKGLVDRAFIEISG